MKPGSIDFREFMIFRSEVIKAYVYQGRPLSCWALSLPRPLPLPITQSSFAVCAMCRTINWDWPKNTNKKRDINNSGKRSKRICETKHSVCTIWHKKPRRNNNDQKNPKNLFYLNSLVRGLKHQISFSHLCFYFFKC